MTAAVRTLGSARVGAGRGPGELLRKLWADKFATAALAVLLVMAVAAIGGPLVAPHSFLDQDLTRRLTPPLWDRGGDPAFPLGTDFLGRDLLSRIIVATRLSLFIGVVTALIVSVGGTTLGLIAGFFRGKVDQVVMGLTDVIMGFPGILLLLAVVAMRGPSLETIILALSIRFWTAFARIGRSLTLSIRETDYVSAARVMGCSDARIIRIHVLPNMLSPILVLAVLEGGRIMLAEAGVSFLGFGIQSPLISWGLMMAEGKNYLAAAWWTVTFPGLALFLTILSMITLQSFLRIATDPLHRPKRFSKNTATG